MISDPHAWKRQAACRGADPALFVTPGTQLQQAQAKAICGQCPVTEECLAFAWGMGASGTIWGGLNDQERALAKRNRSRRVS